MDWQDDTMVDHEGARRARAVDHTTRTDVDAELPWGEATLPEMAALSPDWDVPTLITHVPRPRRGTGSRR